MGEHVPRHQSAISSRPVWPGGTFATDPAHFGPCCRTSALRIGPGHLLCWGPPRSLSIEPSMTPAVPLAQGRPVFLVRVVRRAAHLHGWLVDDDADDANVPRCGSFPGSTEQWVAMGCRWRATGGRGRCFHKGTAGCLRRLWHLGPVRHPFTNSP